MIPTRRIGGRTRERVRREAERVPLLALFVVIVPVFLLAASSAHWAVLDAEAAYAPEAASPSGAPLPEAPADPPRPARLMVGREGTRLERVGASAIPVPSDGLAAALASLWEEDPEEGALTIVAANGASYREVRRVLDLCRDAGFRTVRLETSP
ncbi:MAG: biopolymer transporter ExbD [Candidatus Eisenbacteria bacterium]|nr:biopolymer transporter ExbD [Candidatus Eisenbacteria bacterium]